MPVLFPRHFYVYILVDPRNGDIRYVGSTGNLHVRFVGHLMDSKTDWPISVKNDWIRGLRNANSEPIMQPIVACDSEQEARYHEKEWIRRFRIIGCPLTNGTCRHRVRPKQPPFQYPKGLKRLIAYV